MNNIIYQVNTITNLKNNEDFSDGEEDELKRVQLFYRIYRHWSYTSCWRWRIRSNRTKNVLSRRICDRRFLLSIKKKNLFFRRSRTLNFRRGQSAPVS